ncbi:MAG TPA: methylated-DNA--[protein]-cysteine S-methyltransferase [Actinocrinis sp.]|nr:methylated-DNA--[protein]-cysteine S-methyltransferase [Actinocrinis sp.]
MADLITWVTVPTPLPSGPVHVAVTAEGVAAATFADHPVEGALGVPSRGPRADAAKTATVTARLTEYFEGRRKSFDLPLDWHLTAGPQRTVLQALQRSVGYGETVTYGNLAARSEAYPYDSREERFHAARGVGTVMGSNPLFLFVPCHRVVAADGLGGYGGGAEGMEVKRWLLTLEGVLAPTLDWNGPS